MKQSGIIPAYAGGGSLAYDLGSGNSVQNTLWRSSEHSYLAQRRLRRSRFILDIASSGPVLLASGLT